MFYLDRVCFVPGCHREKSNHENLTYYRLPSSPVLRAEWIKALRVNKHTNDKYAYSQQYVDIYNKYQERKTEKRFCIVAGCTTDKLDLGLSYHQVPVIADVADQWFKFLQNRCANTGVEWKPLLQSARICSQHFVPSDFALYTTTKRRWLTKNAVPTLMPTAPLYKMLDHLEQNTALYDRQLNVYICSKHFVPDDFKTDSHNTRNLRLHDHVIPLVFSVKESDEDIINSSSPSHCTNTEISATTPVIRWEPPKKIIRSHFLVSRDSSKVSSEKGTTDPPSKRALKCYPGRSIPRHSKSVAEAHTSTSIPEIYTNSSLELPQAANQTSPQYEAPSSNLSNSEEVEYFMVDEDGELLDYYDVNQSESLDPLEAVEGTSSLPVYVMSASTQTETNKCISVATQAKIDSSIGFQHQILCLKNKNVALSEQCQKLAKELESEKNKNLILLKTVEILKASNFKMFKINRKIDNNKINTR